jgi:hypothetical protein
MSKRAPSTSAQPGSTVSARQFTCPDCGGSRDRGSTRCHSCEQKRRHKHGIGSSPQIGSSVNGVNMTSGRSESIITFARGSEVVTLHCIGRNALGQITNGLERLPGDGWEVQARSTPQSILADLGTSEMSQQALDLRIRSIANTEKQRPQRPQTKGRA